MFQKLEPGLKDPIDRLQKCGYSANYGGKTITEKIKALSLQKGVGKRHQSFCIKYIITPIISTPFLCSRPDLPGPNIPTYRA